MVSLASGNGPLTALPPGTASSLADSDTMDFFDQLSRVRSTWGKIPEQLKRLSVLAIVAIVLFVPVRNLLVPADFGEYGHYRASALEEAAAQELHYAGHEICNDCHDDIVDTKYSGYHRTVACETCHGPAAAHIDDSDVELAAPRERGFCPMCHEYLASRPTGFPQIVAASHNPLRPCISCHNPHDPVPPETPKECTACHAAIARSKAVSHHVYVDCVHCHETPEEHKINPRQFLPTKPTDREFCGECHSKDAVTEQEIRRVDLSTHGERYTCWQCHYPHLPEAR